MQHITKVRISAANQLTNGQQEATTQQQQFQEMMAAQINAMQQQLEMQQGATAAVMQQSAVAMTSNRRVSTPPQAIAPTTTAEIGTNKHGATCNKPFIVPPRSIRCKPRATTPKPTLVAFSRTKTIVTPTVITSKMIIRAKPARRPAQITIQTPPNSTPWVDSTPGRTRPSCHPSMAVNPAPDRNESPGKATYNGSPQDSHPGPIIGS